MPPTEEWDLEAGVERSLQLEPEDIVPYNVLQLVEEQCGYAVAVEKTLSEQNRENLRQKCPKQGVKT